MATGERDLEDPEFVVTRSEFYTKVGPAVQKLDLLIPTFGEKIIRTMAEIIESGQGVQSGKIIFRHLVGDRPEQVLEVVIGELPSEGGHLTIELNGDWTTKPDIPRGLPIIANYDGAFFRKINDKAPGPIAEIGQTLGPDEPFGLASAGKQKYWPLYLPSREFPNGGIVRKFEVVSGDLVEKEKTVLVYVEP